MDRTFVWRGIDGAGFLYGTCSEGSRRFRLDIALPGRGGNPKGTDHRIYVDGNEVGKASSIEGAQKFLSNFFDKGLHEHLGRDEPRKRRSLADTLKAAAGLTGGKSRGR
ncbi:hypothetical protein Rvan_2815 [Rhodomicrobium vannielii ATCC 17100]|jgi:hypothetical protein|uniref:Uncharacterized protein n=1 Tax=Rhodomicrobium vannielii (strain ATCC 17100 / DSM 162 / LMG 4299 / NCIMB 10020 / ATH 3.1.1) TaxID=648757 RepID=E3I8P5_RHOVT|nr:MULTISPECIES: hypothetical protein [Rhodomicrobium]ADP72024.1 hypothetical protein Rvan_2815 [Rhodomicrobium vannielii ATCC 17100]MBJ7533592.1 hypothetical protein [Rhodomicrobium vannielii ATCC 17100]MBT3072031.1 hypothetical protein [Rhodomicrobium sp. Az07]